MKAANMLIKMKKISDIVPFGLGICTYLYIVGARILNPNNIGWLSNGDPLQSYLGSMYYCYSDWQFPLSANPDYGLENAAGLVFSYANVLMALIWKALSPVIPDGGQYFGIWLLLCFMLQAWFAWLIVGLLSTDLKIRTLGILFFLFSPPMIWRLEGHYNYCAHFLILAALYLAFRSRRYDEMSLSRTIFYWGSLLASTVWISTYFTLMVGAVWLADLIRRYYKSFSSNVLVEFFSILLIIFFFAWLAGCFDPIIEASSAGFGFYKMNLFSPIDSDSVYSFLLKDIASHPGEYEGFNYLGLGIIFLLLISIPALIDNVSFFNTYLKSCPLLFLAMISFFLWSLSNNVGIASFSFSFHLPEFITTRAGMFRVSGRLFWPVLYCLYIAILLVVIRKYAPRTAFILLFIAATCQIGDMSGKLLEFRHRFTAPPSQYLISTLESNFWAAAGKNYKKIRVLYDKAPFIAIWPRYFFKFGPYAGNNRLAINFPYFGREPKTSHTEFVHNEHRNLINSGLYESDTIYLVESSSALDVLQTYKNNDDLFAFIDGVYVLAPGWRRINGYAAQFPGSDLTVSLSSVSIGKEIPIAMDNANPVRNLFLDYNWELGENFVGPMGHKAEMRLPTAETVHKIRLDGYGVVSPSHPQQRFEVLINGLAAGDFVFDGNRKTVEISIPPELQKELEEKEEGIISLDFNLKDAATPKSMGMNDDIRVLSIRIFSIELE